MFVSQLRLRLLFTISLKLAFINTLLIEDQDFLVWSHAKRRTYQLNWRSKFWFVIKLWLHWQLIIKSDDNFREVKILTQSTKSCIVRLRGIAKFRKRTNINDCHFTLKLRWNDIENKYTDIWFLCHFLVKNYVFLFLKGNLGNSQVCKQLISVKIYHHHTD